MKTDPVMPAIAGKHFVIAVTTDDRHKEHRRHALRAMRSLRIQGASADSILAGIRGAK